MPSSELAPTSPQPDSRSSEEVVRRWIVYFGEIHAKEITPALVGLWCQLLADIEPALLERGCVETAKHCRFFPAPADIRAQLDDANASGVALEAEQEWEELLSWVRRYLTPGVGSGIAPCAPALAPAVEFAARTAGGLRWLESCSQTELQWARKRFLETYTRVHETQQVNHLLTRGEARKILGELAARATEQNARLLAPPAEVPVPATSEPERDATAPKPPTAKEEQRDRKPYGRQGPRAGDGGE